MDECDVKQQAAAGDSGTWLALYTKPHKEAFVRDRLRGQGVDVYLPEVQVATPRRDRRLYKPFFPHYLFARLDAQDTRLGDLRWTPGLRSIVSANGQPVPVPDKVVLLLRQRLAAIAPLARQPRFHEGDRLRVSSGPFDGLEAVFDRQLSPNGRVRVFLQLLSRWVMADLDVDSLEPAR